VGRLKELGVDLWMSKRSLRGASSVSLPTERVLDTRLGDDWFRLVFLNWGKGEW
jgi:hypothetical protein